MLFALFYLVKPCYIYGITIFKGTKRCKAMVYSEFITDKGLLGTPLCVESNNTH